jgi:hypothetical protein
MNDFQLGTLMFVSNLDTMKEEALLLMKEQQCIFMCFIPKDRLLSEGVHPQLVNVCVKETLGIAFSIKYTTEFTC